MKTPDNKLGRVYTNCSGHMTKMATMPIYGKNPLRIFSKIRRLVILGLGNTVCSIGDVGPTKFVPYDDPHVYIW